MKLIKFIIQTSPRTFTFAAFAGAAAGLSMVSILALTNKAIHQTDMVNYVMMFVYFALIIAVVVSRVISTVLLTKLSQDSIAQLRMRLSREILAAPLLSLEKIGSHKLLANLSEDITSIGNGVIRVPVLFMNSTILVGCLGYLLWLSWGLFLVVLTLIFIGVKAYGLPRSRAMNLLTKARESNDDLYKGFRAVCEGTKELKMHSQRREDFFTGAFKNSILDYSRFMVKGRTYFSMSSSLGLLLFFIVIGALIFIVPRWIAIESETLIGYVLVLLFMQGPLDGLMNIIPELAKTSVSLDKVESLGLSLNPEFTDKKNTLNNSEVNSNTSQFTFQNSLELRDVTHSYYRELESSYFQLGPVNLTFKPGELVFLIGGNGSGKTTLAKMLLGLYQPESGQILVDGDEVKEDTLEEYRQLFSAVFVDFYLFDQLLGFDQIDLDGKAQGYLEKLQLSHKVSVENGQLSTTQLSQGQKKRLTLMAAYLEDRQFCVFDEWAADQDPEFKKVFYRELLPELRKQGKTVLVISHDEQYFDVADRYIKMDSGQVIVKDSLDEVTHPYS